MRPIVAITQVTLDGIMQSPGGREEDPTNGFSHGGWAMAYGDDVLREEIGQTIRGAFDMLLRARHGAGRYGRKFPLVRENKSCTLSSVAPGRAARTFPGHFAAAPCLSDKERLQWLSHRFA